MDTEAVLTCTHDLCFEQNKKSSTIFHIKITIFTAVKYYRILYGHIIVMINVRCYRNGKKLSNVGVS